MDTLGHQEIQMLNVMRGRADAGMGVGLSVEEIDLTSWSEESGEYTRNVKRGNLSRIVVHMADANPSVNRCQ